MSAAFGAAATLQGWRTSKLLRRLRLSPAPTGSIVGARVVVAILIALGQTAIFVGLASAAFGMQLSGAWWMSVPLIVCGTLSFMSLGLLGWAVAMSAAFGAAATLQGWRNSKLLRRLQLSPVSAGSVVGARVVVTVLIALVQMAIFLGLGMSAFGLRLTGSWWMAVPLLVAGTLAFMSLGLLAGSVAKTQEGAVNLANFLVLPMAFLSGSFFPLDGAPQWLQTLSRLMPLRHLNDAMLDVLVRGEGPSAAVVPMAILLGFALIVGLLATKLFQWEAD
jgi:ABC-2 type transport system permease protein